MNDSERAALEDEFFAETFPDGHHRLFVRLVRSRIARHESGAVDDLRQLDTLLGLLHWQILNQLACDVCDVVVSMFTVWLRDHRHGRAPTVWAQIRAHARAAAVMFDHLEIVRRRVLLEEFFIDLDALEAEAERVLRKNDVDG